MKPCHYGLSHGNIALTIPWWRHQMETFSALLAICAGNSPVPGEFPTQRPVTRSFDVYFDLRPDKRLSKQSWGWWFETLSHSLWRHRNASLAIEIWSTCWVVLTPSLGSNHCKCCTCHSTAVVTCEHFIANTSLQFGTKYILMWNLFSEIGPWCQYSVRGQIYPP